MKKILFILALTATMFATSAEAKAGVRVPYGEYEKIEKVAELPDEFTTDEGVKLSLGHKYTVFQIAYVPLWTLDKGTLVGFDPNDSESYYDFDSVLDNEEGREAILTTAGVTELSELHKIPFWDSWGGKIVGLLVVALILYGIFGREKKSEDSDKEETPEEEK